MLQLKRRNAGNFERHLADVGERFEKQKPCIKCNDFTLFLA